MALYTPTDAVEKVYYDRISSAVNPSGNQVFDNGQVAKFIAQSELTRDVLRDIWNTGTGGSAEVKRPEFFAILRCIALRQAGKPYTREAVVASAAETGLWPKFKGVPLPPAATAEAELKHTQQHATGSRPTMLSEMSGSSGSLFGQDGRPKSPAAATPSDGAAASLLPDAWAMTPSNRMQYEEIFDQQNTVDGKLDGKDAVQFFLQSRLPRDQLRQVWNLSDVDQDGKLTKPEFCVAMHLVMCLTRKSYPVPSQLPIDLATSAGMSLTSYANRKSMDISKPPPSPQNSARPLSVASPMTPPLSETQTTNGWSSANMNVPEPSNVAQSVSAPMPPQSVSSPMAAQSVSTPMVAAATVNTAESDEIISSLATANATVSESTAAIEASNQVIKAENNRIRQEMQRLKDERDTMTLALRESSAALAVEKEALLALDVELDLLRETVSSLTKQVMEKQNEIIQTKTLALEREAAKLSLVNEQNDLNNQLKSMDLEMKSLSEPRPELFVETKQMQPPIREAPKAVVTPPSSEPPRRPAPTREAPKSSHSPEPDSNGVSTPAVDSVEGDVVEKASSAPVMDKTVEDAFDSAFGVEEAGK
mmetsp:Transcript_22797/g.36383  ORF Transcript_22797/g.36383 Transcript_22797/m.36383 type:complete len:592 (+) Transcript_22797:191-1966(+)